MPPAFCHIATFEIAVGAAVDAGLGHRMIPVVGGIVRGARLNGTILAGGADWQQPGAPGAVKIGGRWVMETDDQVRIQVETPGIRRASPEVLSELAAGREIDPARYYFRVAPQFTPSPMGTFLAGAILVRRSWCKASQWRGDDVFSMA